MTSNDLIAKARELSSQVSILVPAGSQRHCIESYYEGYQQALADLADGNDTRLRGVTDLLRKEFAPKKESFASYWLRNR